MIKITKKYYELFEWWKTQNLWRIDDPMWKLEVNYTKENKTIDW